MNLRKFRISTDGPVFANENISVGQLTFLMSPYSLNQCEMARALCGTLPEISYTP